MCKELKTTVLRILPQTTNGPSIQPEEKAAPFHAVLQWSGPPQSSVCCAGKSGSDPAALMEFYGQRPVTTDEGLQDDQLKQQQQMSDRLCLYIYKVDQLDADQILHSTLKALKGGQVVAVPTDTIYGLACLAQSSEAIRRVYDIKGRNGNKPLAICVGEVEDIYKYCKVVVKKELLEDLLPGPVTLVLERSETLNADLNPFTKLVGVRIPDHTFMRRLCQMCEEPLALTSANISSQTSTVAVDEFKELWPRLAVVVDDGTIADQSRLGSTVVDLSVPGRYSIIRPGCAFSATVALLRDKYALLEDSSS